MIGQCDTCAFGVPCMLDEGEVVLKCHRFPPVIVVLDGEVTQVLPQVDELDWCGEWLEEAV